MSSHHDTPNHLGIHLSHFGHVDHIKTLLSGPLGFTVSTLGTCGPTCKTPIHLDLAYLGTCGPTCNTRNHLVLYLPIMWIWRLDIVSSTSIHTYIGILWSNPTFRVVLSYTITVFYEPWWFLCHVSSTPWTGVEMGRPTGFHIDSVIAKFVARARMLFFDIFAEKN